MEIVSESEDLEMRFNLCSVHAGQEEFACDISKVGGESRACREPRGSLPLADVGVFCLLFGLFWVVWAKM